MPRITPSSYHRGTKMAIRRCARVSSAAGGGGGGGSRPVGNARRKAARINRSSIPLTKIHTESGGRTAAAARSAHSKARRSESTKSYSAIGGAKISLEKCEKIG